MKLKFIIPIVVFFITTACGPTNEERAQEMAANYLKGALFRFDSYEPIQTKVDSSYVSLATDKEAIDLTLDMIKRFDNFIDYNEEIETAERTMDIWAPNGYSSAYSSGQYLRAKEKRDNIQKRMEKVMGKIENQFYEIKDRQSELKEGTFDGWRVYHKFKSLNGKGTVPLFGEYIFICDADFKEKYVCKEQEYDELLKIMKAISESDDLDEFIENIQELAY